MRRRGAATHNHDCCSGGRGRFDEMGLNGAEVRRLESVEVMWKEGRGRTVEIASQVLAEVARRSFADEHPSLTNGRRKFKAQRDAY